MTFACLANLEYDMEMKIFPFERQQDMAVLARLQLSQTYPSG